MLKRAPRRITHVCLDLDGTLADSIPALLAVYERFMARFGLSGSFTEFQELNGPTIEQIVGILMQRYPLPGSAADLAAIYRDEIARAYRDTVKPMPGAHNALVALKQLGYSSVLVTSNVQPIAAGFLDTMGWGDLFIAKIFGADVPQAKPDPEIYRIAMERSSAEPGRAAAVEDSLNGIRSAAAAGAIPIGFLNEHAAAELRSAGARFILGHFDELPMLLQRMEMETP